MPLYTFKCKNCKHIFEDISSYNTIKNKKCIKCKSKKLDTLLGKHTINMNGIHKSDEDPLSGIVRVPEYADRKTGKKLGYGPIESIKRN